MNMIELYIKFQLDGKEIIPEGIKSSSPKTILTHKMDKHMQAGACSFMGQIYSLQSKVSRPNGLKEEEEQQLEVILKEFKDVFQDLP